MSPTNKFISDLAQMANGAASALGGVREDIEMIRRGRQDRQQAAEGQVTREDFDSLVTRIEALAARIAVLEAATARPKRTKKASDNTNK